MTVTMKTIESLIGSFVREHVVELKRIDFVVGVSRGGLIPAALIATGIDKPLVAAYIDRQDRVSLDRGAWLKGKRVLLVDDIVRTGKTFKKIHALLARTNPASIESFSLYSLTTASVFPTWTIRRDKDQKMPWDL